MSKGLAFTGVAAGGIAWLGITAVLAGVVICAALGLGARYGFRRGKSSGDV